MGSALLMQTGRNNSSLLNLAPSPKTYIKKKEGRFLGKDGM